MLPLSSDDRISSVLPVGGDGSASPSETDEESASVPKEEHFLVMLTRSGYIKKTPLSAFQKINR